ncbi:MAG: alpha-2-macroglobulin family protein, partial [Prevotella sp.]
APDRLLYLGATPQFKSLIYKDFAPSRIDATLFPLADLGKKLFSTLGNKARGMQMMKAKAVSAAAPVSGAVPVNTESAAMENKTASVEEQYDESADVMQPAEGEIQMRENLNETAFFFPELQTDKSGNVTLKFTLPESLTSWRFLGFAHTTDMKYGSLTAEAVASKDLMVQPNVPRFVRSGDKVQITARIFNTGTARDAGKAKLELLDPETEKVVASVVKPFSVDAGETNVVTFEIQPSDKHSLYICRVTASGKKFSDGEQHYLPVLPDKETVLVTLPFSQTEAGTKTVELNKLFPDNAEKSALTIEYTNNPAWLMLQSLPTVGVPDGDNAVSLASALYANGVAAAIIGGNTRLKNVFEQWKRDADDTVSLTSPLARNSELKDIVLAETPWAADADKETEQKQRLADFFDTNTIDNRLSVFTSKLASLQNSDGSWSWWKGMDGNMPMTTEVAQMLVRLNAMAGKNKSTASMLERAFKYMGEQVVKDVEKMKEAEKRGVKPSFPGITALRFLYMSVLDGRKQSAEVRSANKYLVELLKKEIGNQTIYDKAVTAIILAGNGETEKSREYVKSLKEYTVYDESKGRYYDTRRAAYSWCDYRIPTQVAAIEAITKVTPDDAVTIDEMRRWLLHEKRTQAWDTPISSVNAVYAFLNGNMTVLEAKENVKAAIDGKRLDMPRATAAIGYVKTSIAEPSGKTLTFTKISEGTSWGAVYARFTQKTADVESSSAGISVRKEIVSSDNELTVGSRITVRITIETAHDLDFVQIADRRAACMEPVSQLSGYRNGSYCSPKDNATYYYFNSLPKGKHVVETQYYIDRAGTYETGTCSAGCAYAPEYRATAKSTTLIVKQ